MTAFGESDKKRILDSMTADDLTILKGAFAVYDKGQMGLHVKRLYKTICLCWNSLNPNQFKLKGNFLNAFLPF